MELRGGQIGHRALLLHDITGVPSYVPTDEMILQFVGLGGRGGLRCGW